MKNKKQMKQDRRREMKDIRGAGREQKLARKQERKAALSALSLEKKQIKQSFKARAAQEKATQKELIKACRDRYREMLDPKAPIDACEIETEKDAQKAEKAAAKAAKKAEKQEKADQKRAKKRLLPVIEPPKRAVLEEIGNAVTHGVGSLFAVWALISMLMHSHTAVQTVSACLYAGFMFIMFTMSCLYHAFRHGSAVKRLFRRFDHLSIYLLIGATFIPPLLCYVGGVYGTAFFLVQWIIIATGVSLMGVFGPTKLKWLHFPLYIVLGWSALMLLPRMLAGDVGMALFILAGGVVYSLGIIPFLLKRGPSHFIWHFFVLAGAVVQWIGIRLYIYP